MQRADPSLESRYQRLVRETVPRFRDKNRLTTLALSQEIGVERTRLTRFLSEHPDYVPRSTRPRCVELLEQLEAHCASRNNYDSSALDAYWRRRHPGKVTDAEAWYDTFHAALMVIQQHPPGEALAAVPSLCAQACAAPAREGMPMATNLLMVIGGLLDQKDAGDVSRTLLRKTEERVRSLLDSALCNVKKEEWRHNPIGHAGHDLAWLGLLLDDPRCLTEGLTLLLDAVARPHPPEDGHWSNLLVLLDVLWRRGNPMARDWSQRVAATARTAAGTTHPWLPSLIAEFRSAPFYRHWIEVHADIAA